MSSRIIYIPMLCLFLLLNCDYSDKQVASRNWITERTPSPAASHQIEYLNAAVIRSNYTNSDSAIYYYNRIINMYHKEQMHRSESNTIIALSELYNTRKSDGIKALYYYNKAVKIMIQNNGREDSSPYFYVDMANLFISNKLYQQAIESCEKAILIASEVNDNFAVSVAQNNIGIAYREMGKYDSSIIYFRKSLEIRKKIAPVYEAHNYMYLARIFAKTNMTDSMLYYRRLTLDALKRVALYQKEKKERISDLDKALIINIHIDDANILATYYKNKGNLEQAIKYYKFAMQETQKSQDNISSSSYLYNIALLYDSIQNYKEAFTYAQSTYQLSKKHNNYKSVVSASKLLSALYSKRNDKNMVIFYKTQAINYADSARNEDDSKQLNANKILLITNQTNESLIEYKHKEEKDLKLIKNQNLRILSLAILSAVLLIIVFYIRQKKEQITKEQKQLMATMKTTEESASRAKTTLKARTFISVQMEEKLVELIEKEKIYVDKNLSLQTMAAKLNTNTTYLSQYFNIQLETSFSDYINAYRIKEACRMLKQDEYKKYSIAQIADMVGFGSLTTFYTTFKKIHGVTPVYFQKNL